MQPDPYLRMQEQMGLPRTNAPARVGTGALGLPFDYVQQLRGDLENADEDSMARGAGHVKVYGGGTMGGSAPRASMTALRGMGGRPASWDLRGLPDDYQPPSPDDDPFAGMTPEGRAYRKGQMATTESRRQMDLGGEATRRARNEQNFDINSGQFAARARAGQEAANEGAESAARSQAGIYMSPEQGAVRRSQFADEMDRIRARYSDPAIARGVAADEAARIRAGASNYGADAAARSRENVANIQGRTAGNTDDARIRQAAITAAGRQGQDVTQFEQPPQSQARTFTMDDVRRVMREQGVDAEAALNNFMENGYRLSPGGLVTPGTGRGGGPGLGAR